MQSGLKQRLIGAVVLIALAVIFLPMLVQGPAPDSGVADLSLDVPDAPRDGMETRDLPLVAPQAPPAGAVTDPDPDLPAPAPRAADGDALPTVDTAAERARGADAPGEAFPPTAAAGDYVVNFGAYATQRDAEAIVAQLRGARLPASQLPVKIGARDAFRVRIGPYATRADAEQARLAAGAVRGDVQARVVTLDAATVPAAQTASPSTPVAAAATPAVTATALPEEPKPQPKPLQGPAAATTTAATTPPPAPAQPATPPAPKPPAGNAAAVGFVVQLGAFSKPADADALRDKVRAAGFNAFTDRVTTDRGTLTRVKAGPVTGRAEADQLRAQVRAKTGTDGIVRPHP